MTITGRADAREAALPSAEDTIAPPPDTVCDRDGDAALTGPRADGSTDGV